MASIMGMAGVKMPEKPEASAASAPSNGVNGANGSSSFMKGKSLVPGHFGACVLMGELCDTTGKLRTESSIFLAKTNLPTPIWQGLCEFTGG